MLSDLLTALGGFGVRLPAAALGAAPANESISLTAAKAFMALGDEQRRRQDGGAPPKIASLLQAALMKLPGSPFAVPEYTARAMQGVFAKERAYLNERFGIATEADTGIECVDERQFYGFDAEEVGRLLRAINDLLVARDKPAGPGSTS